MRSLASLLSFLILASACSGGATVPTAPTPLIPVPSPAPPTEISAEIIHVGQEVKGTLTSHGESYTYELTAPSDGALVAQLGWDSKHGRLELELAGVQVGAENGNPIIGKLRVTAGQKYRLIVADGAPWDYDVLNLPYVLLTRIE